MLEEKQPDYLFVAFDLPGPDVSRTSCTTTTRRSAARCRADLVPQYPPIRRRAGGAGRPDPGAAPASRPTTCWPRSPTGSNELGGECYLVTGDKDCRQLITDRVKVYNIRKDQVFDAAALQADWGIRPDQVVDFQALVGDSVDNVPGVPLIGPKIASEYCCKSTTRSTTCWPHAAELPKGKRKENLIAEREQALLSRELVRLDRARADRRRLGRRPRAAASIAQRLAELFAEFGFHTLRASKFATLPERRAAEQRLAGRLPGRSTRPSSLA